jgi:hypothetical protein
MGQFMTINTSNVSYTGQLTVNIGFQGASNALCTPNNQDVTAYSVEVSIGNLWSPRYISYRAQHPPQVGTGTGWSDYFTIPVNCANSPAGSNLRIPTTKDVVMRLTAYYISGNQLQSYTQFVPTGAMGAGIAGFLCPALNQTYQ